MGLSPTVHPPAAAGEMQSTITMVDFFRVWFRFRIWFVSGLIVVFALTWIWSKLVLRPLYKAESTIFVSAGVPLGMVEQAVEQAARPAETAEGQAVKQVVKQVVGKVVEKAAEQFAGQAVGQVVGQAAEQAVGQIIEPSTKLAAGKM